jgi:hypothetical protein
MNGYYRFALLAIAVALYATTKIWAFTIGMDFTMVFMEWTLDFMQLLILVLLSIEMHKLQKVLKK